MISARAGTPSPTANPSTTLLLTPPVSLSSQALTSPAAPVGPGTNEVGTPEDDIIFRAPVPNGTGLATDATFVTGKVGVTPDATAVTRVITDLYVDDTCSEAGQLITPDDRHDCPVKTAVEVNVVVVKRVCLASSSAVGAAARSKTPRKPLEEDVGEEEEEEVAEGDAGGTGEPVLRLAHAEARVV